MKHNRVLNRPMFNPNVSAYGRGITTNLVTEQERQKFNAGGRVRYQEGDEVAENVGFGESPIWKGARGLYDYVGKPALNVFNQIVSDPIATAFGYSETFNPMETPWDITEDKSMWENLKTWPKRYSKDTSEPQVVNKEGEATKWIPEIKEEVVDEESDVIDWTPEEKQEKKGQIQLAMAERLIGGARDPLGSTKQQKNLAGMFGDIRKITDKEDLRKWKRRYDAEADAYVKKSEKVATIARGYDNLVGQGAEPSAALYRSSGIKSKTIPIGKAKENKKAYKGVKSGDVIWDENQTSWYIMTPDGLVTVTKDQILEANKSGKLKELKELGISKFTEKS